MMAPHAVRFAPSPTGRFHVGNLRTAWISHEWARRTGRAWVVRFEDIDQPRVVAGAQDQQLADLAALGLRPDQVVVQSDRHARHRDLFARAVASGDAYPCFCSRKEVLEAMASAPHRPDALYSGHCRPSSLADSPRRHEHPTTAWRLKGADPSGALDFLIARTSEASFAPAYPWACAIDDHDGQYGLLVRAADLAHAAGQQRAVQAWLCALEGIAPPRHPAIYHTALVVQGDGARLEKRTAGVTLGELEARGISATDLVRRFELSLEGRVEWRAFQAGEIFGEVPERITLMELGL